MSRRSVRLWISCGQPVGAQWRNFARDLDRPTQGVCWAEYRFAALMLLGKALVLGRQECSTGRSESLHTRNPRRFRL
jgi:hypothetical protein